MVGERSHGFTTSPAVSSTTAPVPVVVDDAEGWTFRWCVARVYAVWIGDERLPLIGHTFRATPIRAAEHRRKLERLDPANCNSNLLAQLVRRLKDDEELVLHSKTLACIRLPREMDDLLLHKLARVAEQIYIEGWRLRDLETLNAYAAYDWQGDRVEALHLLQILEATGDPEIRTYTGRVRLPHLQVKGGILGLTPDQQHVVRQWALQMQAIRDALAKERRQIQLEEARLGVE